MQEDKQTNRLKCLIRFWKLYKSGGWGVLPAFLYRVWDKEKEKWKKKPIYGPFKSEYATPQWECDWETFLNRVRALDSILRVKSAGGFNSLIVKTGEESGITILDLDCHDHPEISQKILQYVPEGVPESWTPSGGRHYFFRFDPECPTRGFKDYDIDILSSTPCILSPSNVHGFPIPYRSRTPLHCCDRLKDASTSGPIPYKRPFELPAFPVALKGFLYGPPRTPGRVLSGPPKEYRKRSLVEIEEMLKAIVGAVGRPDYYTWLKLLSAIWSEYTYEESRPLIQRVMPEPEYKLSQKYEHRLEQVGMGTLVHLYRELSNRP